MYVVHWPRALMVSAIFHIVCLVGIGYMTASLFIPEPAEEQLLELDLSVQPLAEDSGNTAAVDNREQAVPAAVRTVQPAAAGEPSQPIEHNAAAQVVAVSEAMSLEAVETAVAGVSSSAGSTPDGGAAGGVAAGGTANTAGGTGSAGQGQGGGSRGNISPPSILSKVEPRYPEMARQSGQAGTVLLRIQILENGRPGTITLARSSGYEELDDVAMEAVRQWRFVPAKDRDSGQALRCYTTLPVTFQIR